MKNIKILFIVGLSLLVVILTPVLVIGYAGNNSVKADPLDSLVVAKGEISVTPINCSDAQQQIHGSIQNIGNVPSPDVTIEVTIYDYAGRLCDVPPPGVAGGKVLVSIGTIAAGQTVPFTAGVITTDTALIGSWTYRILTPDK